VEDAIGRPAPKNATASRFQAAAATRYRVAVSALRLTCSPRPCRGDAGTKSQAHEPCSAHSGALGPSQHVQYCGAPMAPLTGQCCRNPGMIPDKCTVSFFFNSADEPRELPWTPSSTSFFQSWALLQRATLPAVSACLVRRRVCCARLGLYPDLDSYLCCHRCLLADLVADRLSERCVDPAWGECRQVSPSRHPLVTPYWLPAPRAGSVPQQ
jgi:hypothetical protein